MQSYSTKALFIKLKHILNYLSITKHRCQAPRKILLNSCKTTFWVANKKTVTYIGISTKQKERREDRRNYTEPCLLYLFNSFDIFKDLHNLVQNL